MARGDVAFELNGLAKGHGGLFVSTGLQVNQAHVMQTNGVVLIQTLGDFEAFNGFAVFLVFGVEDAQAVVGGGVLLVEFEDGKEGALSAAGLAFLHGGLGNAPELFHLVVKLG